MLLKGKNAIITGANRGIGRAIVESFAQNGAGIWAHQRNETPEFESDMAEVSSRYNVEIIPIHFDLTDSERMKSAVKEIVASKRPVDILVNNAGVAHGGLFQMTPMAKIREIFDIDFFAPIEFSQYIVRLMKKVARGSIVNLVSIAGQDLKSGNIAYGVSKAALAAATSTLAAELGASGIRVNAVAPGLTDTEMASLMEEKALSDMIEASAMKRMAQPKEIADVVVFLASDLSSFVSGQVLRVDGGKC